MSFRPRPYPEIVTDVLVALTQGVVREPVAVPVDFTPATLLFLSRRPVRRVSSVQGLVRQGGIEVRRTLTEKDWALVSSTGNSDALDALQLRPRGLRPIAGTTLEVSYWPRETPPQPLTDLNVGSVTRTLMETLARELADQQVQLERVYRSAFVETADGDNLDKVVALLGIDRVRAGRPRGRVRFARRAGIRERVTIPVGTVVLAGDDLRHRTTREVVMLEGESSVEAPVVAEADGTRIVDAGAIDRLALALAGVESVTNEVPTWIAAEDETDVELRDRARRAFHGVGRGTLDALVYGLGGLDFVQSVGVTEFPGDQPGVVHLDLALEDPDDAEAVGIIDDTIARLRPAGVRVTWGAAVGAAVVVDVVRVVLAGAPSLPVREVQALLADLQDRVSEAITKLAAGKALSAARVAAVGLRDDRIEDLELAFRVDGGAPSPGVQLPVGKTAQVTTPWTFPAAAYAESPDGTTTVRLKVGLVAPVLLVGDSALSAARARVRAGLDAWLAALPGSGGAVDFAAVADAIRDDAVFSLVRADAALLLEADGRFERLGDGDGARAVADHEQVVLDRVQVDLWEEPA